MYRTVLAFVFFLAVLSATTTASLAGRLQLTPAQVRDLFIGKPWHSTHGAFFFSESGAYTYKPHKSTKPIDWLPYRMLGDGTLAGPKTSYTFYKSTFGYEYYHSRSKKFYSASPNKKFQPFMTAE